MFRTKEIVEVLNKTSLTGATTIFWNLSAGALEGSLTVNLFGSSEFWMFGFPDCWRESLMSKSPTEFDFFTF